MPYIMNSGKPILIVENNENERRLLTKALSAIDKAEQVAFFPSGIELLQHLDSLPEEDAPSLVVIDYKMPVLNGKQTLALIRSHSAHHGVPVIVYSSGALSILQNEFKDLNVLTCIEKGKNFDKLTEQMKFFFELIADDVETLLGE
jgi:CheY-like chemotaxis protein